MSWHHVSDWSCTTVWSISSSICKLCWDDKVCERAIRTWRWCKSTSKMWCTEMDLELCVIWYSVWANKSTKSILVGAGSCAWYRVGGASTCICHTPSYLHSIFSCCGIAITKSTWLCVLGTQCVFIHNMQDGDGNTALIKACRNGHSETARLLLERGAIVNFQNKVR